MTKEERFRAMSQRLVRSFKLGDFTLMDQDEDYDPSTGDISGSTTTDVLPGAITDIEDEKFEHSYRSRMKQIIIAGADLSNITEPKTGMKIKDPSNNVHLIERIETDQYKAAYYLHVVL